MSEWKVREMSALLEEIRYMRKRMQVIYEACGASCGNSVHIHRCMTPESQEHEAHICEDCGYEWTQTEAALRVPGGCDCSRCQTEGCVANTYCPCCLKAEHDVLRAQIERVRELCDNKQREVEESDPLFGPPLTLTVPDVLRALGDSDG